MRALMALRGGDRHAAAAFPTSADVRAPAPSRALRDRAAAASRPRDWTRGIVRSLAPTRAHGSASIPASGDSPSLRHSRERDAPMMDGADRIEPPRCRGARRRRARAEVSDRREDRSRSATPAAPGNNRPAVGRPRHAGAGARASDRTRSRLARSCAAGPSAPDHQSFPPPTREAASTRMRSRRLSSSTGFATCSSKPARRADS